MVIETTQWRIQHKLEIMCGNRDYYDKYNTNYKSCIVTETTQWRIQHKLEIMSCTRGYNDKYNTKLEIMKIAADTSLKSSKHFVVGMQVGTIIKETF